MSEARGKVLLIVEDHSPLRDLLHDWLEHALSDCRCMVAGSGAEALRMVAVERPGVVLLDTGLADISALEVLNQIESAAPETAVVMLSDYDAPAYQRGVQRQIVRAYIQKDRLYTDLPPVLAELLGGRRSAAGSGFGTS